MNWLQRMMYGRYGGDHLSLCLFGLYVLLYLLSAIPVPDISMRNKEIHLIQGEVTSPINPKPGCRFAACCPMARPECSQESPPLREVSPNHFVACHLEE